MKLNVKTLCITLIALYCLLISTAFGQSVQEKTMFYGEKITGLSISNSFNVSVIKGDDNYLKLEYDPIFEGRIEAKITNGILDLRLSKGNYKTNSKIVLNAIVCVSDLTKVTASGSVDIYFVGEYSPKSVSINITGASDIVGLRCNTEEFILTATGASDAKDFKITSNKIKITALGSSDIVNFNLEGNNADLAFSGASDFENSVLKVNNIIINATGASDIENVKCFGKDLSIKLVGSSGFETSIVQVDNLKIEMTGSSSCSVSGKATTAMVFGTGSTSASMKDVGIENLTTTLLDESNGSFKVNSKLSFEISGESNLHIYGNPHIEKSTTNGGSSVRYN